MKDNEAIEGLIKSVYKYTSKIFVFHVNEPNITQNLGDVNMPVYLDLNVNYAHLAFGLTVVIEGFE